MNKIAFSLLAFFVLTALAFSQPKLTIVGGNSGYNWGDVRPHDTPLKATIVMKNEGDSALIFLEVKPSCGCTTSKLSKDTLQPGESTQLEISLNLGSNVGLLQKNINIRTNDPTQSAIRYGLTANIITDIVCKPMQRFTFNNIQVGETKTSTVTMKNNSKVNITFSNMVVTPPIVDFTLPKTFTLKPGEEIDIVGSFTAKEVGYINSKVTFTTDNKDYPTYIITAYGRVVESPIMNNPEKK